MGLTRAHFIHPQRCSGAAGTSVTLRGAVRPGRARCSPRFSSFTRSGGCSEPSPASFHVVAIVSWCQRRHPPKDQKKSLESEIKALSWQGGSDFLSLSLHSCHSCSKSHNKAGPLPVPVFSK